MSAFSAHEKPIKGKTDCWLTPLEMIRKLPKFDLDPCGQKNHNTANKIYSEKENGLTLPWNGFVFLNPPYSQVGLWLEKMREEIKTNDIRCITLLFARTDTKWFQKFSPLCTNIFFLKGRIKFLTPAFETLHTATAPSIFLTFNFNFNFKHAGFEGIQFVN